MARTHRWLPLVLSSIAIGVVPAGLAGQEQDDLDLEGDIVSAVTGEPVAGAWVALEGYGYGTYSRGDGDFWLPDVPAAPRRFDVQALGYLPETILLDPSTGEQMIELEPDPAVKPGLDFLLFHLENRRNAGRLFDREVLSFSGAYDLGEFLRMHGVRRVRKFCLDEEHAPGLQTMDPGHFYMVEMHGSTARAYTQEFLEETAREDLERIQQIVRLYMTMC